MGVTKNPCSANLREAFSAASGAPTIKGTIGLCALARPRWEVNACALARGFAQSSGSFSMIVKAAIAAAAMAGGRAVE